MPDRKCKNADRIANLEAKVNGAVKYDMKTEYFKGETHATIKMLQDAVITFKKDTKQAIKSLNHEINSLKQFKFKLIGASMGAGALASVMISVIFNHMVK